MGFLKRVKEEVESQPQNPQLPLSEDCVWTVWAEEAVKQLENRNLVTALDCWVQAVSRFDGNLVLYEKLHDEIYSKVSRYLQFEAIEGRVISSHKFVEIDREYQKKSEMPVSMLSEDIFYFVKETLADATSPEETAMMYISGAYSYLGIFRFSTDLRDVSEKCREVGKFGDYALEHCGTFPRHGYRGKIKPVVAINFITSIRDFFMYLADQVDKRIALLNSTQMEFVINKRKKTQEDLNGPLGDALQYCIQASGSKPIKSEKTKKVLLELIDKYVEAFVRTV